MNVQKFENLKTWIFIAAGLVFLGYYFRDLKTLTPLSTIGEYFTRADMYLAYMKTLFLFALPAVICLVWAMSRISRSSRAASRISHLLSEVPAIVFNLVLPLLFVCMAAVTAFKMLNGTPRIFDAFNYWFQAKNFSLGQLYAAVPPLPEYFQFPFIIMENGKWFGSVYPGYPLVLSLGVAVNCSWIVNPILGGLALFVLYRAGRDFVGENLARVAVILCFISPFFRMMAAIHMSHMAALLWILIGNWMLWRWATHRKNCRIWIPLLAGLALGFTYITRPQAGAVIILPFIIFALFNVRQFKWRQIAVFILPLIVFYGLILAYNHSLTGDVFTNPRYFVDPGRRLGFGEDIGEPLPGGSRSGHNFTKGLRNLETLITLWNSDMFGWGSWRWLGLSSLLLVLALMLPERKMIEILFAAGIVLNLSLYFFYFTPSPNFGPRYLAEAIPATIFLTVIGGNKLNRFLGKITRSPDRAREFMTLCPIVLTLITAPVFLSLHQAHYGILPPILEKSALPTLDTEEPAFILLSPGLYKMNVFTWNSPDLNGNVILRDEGEDQIRKLKTAFHDYSFYRVEEIPEHSGKLVLTRLPGNQSN